MSAEAFNPRTVHPPLGAYSHAIAAGGPGRTLYISGQLGIDYAGTLVQGFEAQAQQCWRNIAAILEASGMTARDLVKVTTFVTDISQAGALAAIREPFLQGTRPASTLLAVAALMSPEWAIEIEAIAFKPE